MVSNFKYDCLDPVLADTHEECPCPSATASIQLLPWLLAASVQGRLRDQHHMAAYTYVVMR